MNEERIDAILSQCEGPLHTMYEPNIDYQKFAELIIRECCLLADDHSEEKILNHFGLE